MIGGQPVSGHWRKTRTLMIVILVLLAIFAIVVPALAPTLNKISFFGFPLGFFATAEVSLSSFVILCFVYSFVQGRIDKEYDVHEEEEN